MCVVGPLFGQMLVSESLGFSPVHTNMTEKEKSQRLLAFFCNLLFRIICIVLFYLSLLVKHVMQTQTIVKRTHTCEEQECNANTHNIVDQNELKLTAMRCQGDVSTHSKIHKSNNTQNYKNKHLTFLSSELKLHSK